MLEEKGEIVTKNNFRWRSVYYFFKEKIHGTSSCVKVFTAACQQNPVITSSVLPTLSHPVSLRSSLILFFYQWLVPSCLFPSSFPTNNLNSFLISPKHIPHPSNSPWFHQNAEAHSINFLHPPVTSVSSLIIHSLYLMNIKIMKYNIAFTLMLHQYEYSTPSPFTRITVLKTSIRIKTVMCKVKILQGK